MGNPHPKPVVNSENSIEEGAVNVSVGNNTWIIILVVSLFALGILCIIGLIVYSKKKKSPILPMNNPMNHLGNPMMMGSIQSLNAGFNGYNFGYPGVNCQPGYSNNGMMNQTMFGWDGNCGASYGQHLPMNMAQMAQNPIAEMPGQFQMFRMNQFPMNQQPRPQNNMSFVQPTVQQPGQD